MRQARARAFSRVREPESKHSDDSSTVVLASSDPVDEGHSDVTRRMPLEKAIERLNADERRALEGALVHGLSYAELAAHSGQSIGTIKGWIRSGLAKMQEALQVPGEQA